MNLEEVARLAGVSRSTVSRVINDDTRVSDHARQAVLAVIAEHNFQPHAAARSLASRRTRILGLQIPGAVSFIFSDPYFPNLVQGVVDACNEADFGLMLMMEPANNPGSAERLYQRVIRGRHLDGVILATSILDDPFIERVAHDDLPAVIIGRHPSLTTIDVDNRNSARDAVAHLIWHGYGRIACIGGPADSIASQDRYAGYCQAHADAGRTADPDLYALGDFTERSGYLRMTDLLCATATRPDAVFAGSDTMAVGAIRAIQDMGLRIPEDIALIGFDGLQRHAVDFPNLSTVVQPIADLGKTAVQTLISRMHDRAQAITRTVLPTRLEFKGSCGCAGQTADPRFALDDAARGHTLVAGVGVHPL